MSGILVVVINLSMSLIMAVSRYPTTSRDVRTDRYQEVSITPILMFPLTLVILASSLLPGENLPTDSILADLTVSSKPGTFGLLMARPLCAMSCLYLVVSRLESSTKTAQSC